MNTIEQVSFHKITSAFGPVFRASFKGCRLELSNEKDHLQVIHDETEKHDSFRVAEDGQCEFENSDDVNNTVCESWTEEEWSAVQNAIREA